MHHKHSDWFEKLLKGFINLGILFTTITFLLNRSLWIDEAALSLNIVQKSIYGLSQPLGYLQIAPIGFLYIEKFFITVFGNHDWALRIFPFISYPKKVSMYIMEQKMHFNFTKVYQVAK